MSTWGPLPRSFDRACSYYPDRVALIDGERGLTYREMQAWSNRVANGLVDIGVGKGDRVGMLLPNCLEFIPTQQGVWKSGGVVVQMPPKAGSDDHIFFLTEANASVLVYHDSFEHLIPRIRAEVPSVKILIQLGDNGTNPTSLDFDDLFNGQRSDAPDVEIADDDLAYIPFTSGTTGIPKGVLHTHETWSHYAITAGLEIADSRPGEVFAHGAPLTHFTQSFVLPTFIRGGTNVILPGLEVEGFVDAVQRHRVTASAVVPTVLYLLLDHPELERWDLSSLRTLVYAGSPMAPARLGEALHRFGPIFIQTYAGTEPGYTSVLRKEEHRIESPEWENRLRSAGRAMFHVEVSVQDEDDTLLAPGEIGEVCARQPGQMVGYVDETRDPEAMRGGWVHSGDIGYVDDDGYLYIVDRKKDMIITGGYNVFPRQIEDVLAENPAVRQSAVIGVPDPKWGEAVKAFVVTHSGTDVGPAELIALVRERKGPVWAPKSVEFVEALPVNASGKVDKKALRATYWSGQEREVS